MRISVKENQSSRVESDVLAKDRAANSSNLDDTADPSI
jgi:hypothetical protein